MNTPFGNSITTAEHAIAMMFACARQIPAADASTQAGKWEKSRFMGTELTGKTLGLIGAGNIGSVVAARAIGLKMKVIAYDPFLSAERAQALGIERIEEVDDLLARADFVTLHVPKTEKTANIISAERVAKMKPGARLINCARGGLVDEAAVAEALKSGHLAGAAFDVFAEEPAKENPLFGAPNVVCTPHLGAATTEAQENVALQVAEQMSDYLMQGAISNALNAPSVTAEEAPILKPWIDLAEHARQLRRPGHRQPDQGDRDRVCRRGRRAQPEAADRGADRRPAQAAGRRGRGQHGLGPGRRPRARHPDHREPQGRAGRLRLLHAADRHHRGA